MIPFLENSRKCKLILRDGKQISSCLRREDVLQRSTNLRGGRQIHHLDFGDGVTEVDVCQSSPNCTLYMCNLSYIEYTLVKLKILSWSKENLNKTNTVHSTPEKAMKRDPQVDGSWQIPMVTSDFSSVTLHARRQWSHRVWTEKKVMNQKCHTPSSCLLYVKMTAKEDHSYPFLWKKYIRTRSRWFKIKTSEWGDHGTKGLTFILPLWESSLRK